jgi:hypothetical protein
MATNGHNVIAMAQVSPQVTQLRCKVAQLGLENLSKSWMYSIGTTLRTHTHLSPTHKKQAIKLIDQAFGGVEVTQKLTQGEAGVANSFVN